MLGLEIVGATELNPICPQNKLLLGTNRDNLPVSKGRYQGRKVDVKILCNMYVSTYPLFSSRIK